MGTWLRRIGGALLLLLLMGRPGLACAGQESDEFCGHPPPACAAACCSQDFCHGSGRKECNHTGCESGMCCPDFRPSPVAPAPWSDYDLDRALVAQTPTPLAPIRSPRALEDYRRSAFHGPGYDQPPVPPPRD